MWAYWNETRGAVFKKQQFITVCYSTCVRIEMKQEGSFQKNNNLLPYVIQLVCVLKWNNRDSFQKNKKNNLLQYAIQLVCVLKWNKRAVFKKIQLMTICYWTHVKWRGSFQKYQTNLLQYVIQLMGAYWNETRDCFQKVFKKTTIYYSMLIQLVSILKWNKRVVLVCILKWNKRAVFKKIQLMTICYWTHVWNEGAVFKYIKPIYYSMLFNSCA